MDCNLSYDGMVKAAMILLKAVYFLHYLLYSYAVNLYRLLVPAPMKSLEGEIFLVLKTININVFKSSDVLCL